MADTHQEVKQNAERRKSQENHVLLENVAFQEGTSSNLQYRINESPPIYISLFIATQHLMICFASTLTLSMIIGDVLCAKQDSPLRSKLFSTALGMSGLNTVAQSLLGSRLPMFQGPSFTFISPLIALGSDPAWSCSSDVKDTNISAVNASEVSHEERFTTIEKLQLMSGSLMAASAVEVVVGALGLVGVLMRCVGPITVAPTISLIGLSLYKLPITYSRPCPPMAGASAVLVLVCSLYLQKIQIPFGCGKNRIRLPIFQVLPVLISISLVWIVAAILTSCGVFPDDPQSLGYLARTDAKVGIVDSTPWLLFTYPGQYGMPSVHLGAFVGFTAAVVSSIVESVGDYLAVAQVCEVPPPPQHAVSRGLLFEGLGSVLSGAYGAGHATATYSGNIALLSLCRTGSRSVLVISGIILVVVSFVGKLAAAFSTVPEPILGGIFLVIIGILIAIGISALKYVDLRSSRNLIIIGVAIFVGMVIPDWIVSYPDFIDTGNTQGNQVIRVTLGTPMILGGIVACFLDNTVPGTLRERGLHKWLNSSSRRRDGDDSSDSSADMAFIEDTQSVDEVYGWRWYPALLRRCRVLSYLPFLPPRTSATVNWTSSSKAELDC